MQLYLKELWKENGIFLRSQRGRCCSLQLEQEQCLHWMQRSKENICQVVDVERERNLRRVAEMSYSAPDQKRRRAGLLEG